MMGNLRRSHFLLLLVLTQCHSVFNSLDPKFDTAMVNVTAQEKTTAELPCAVSSLGHYQVVWTDQFSTLLTYQENRIIDDERLSVERPYTRDWNLHIRDVRYSDQGIYNCQINTNPVMIKSVNLIVLVPARILDSLSSSNVMVKEGETVTLVCNVTGTPQPTVTWYRLRTDPKGVEKQKVGVSGEVLIIHNVTRDCGDGYECVAFNGVPPAVSRVVQVFVQFAPEISLPNKRIWQEKGKETILECAVYAFPHAVTMWQKDGVKIGTSTLKYRVEVYDEEKDSLNLSLRIFDIQESDFGSYTCVASNPFGDDQETMVLFDYAEHTKTTITTTATTTTIISSYTQPTPGLMFDPSAHSSSVQRHQSGSDDHYLDREFQTDSQNVLPHDTQYAPSYGPSDSADSRAYAKTDEDKSSATGPSRKWKCIETVATAASVILFYHELL